MIEVALRSGIPGRSKAVLRELSGFDESFVAASVPSVAAELVDRLLTHSVDAAAVSPGDAAQLPVADLDRILVALYVQLFGARVEGQAVCAACDEPFEASFSLIELQAHVEEGAQAHCAGPDSAGYFELTGDARFRLPTTADFRSAGAAGEADAQVAHVAKACLSGGDDEVDLLTLQEAMERVGPTYDIDVSATCVECGALQSVPFELRSYLFAAIRNDAVWRIRETHAIARAYGWSLTEIMGLTRSERRSFVALIAGEAQAPVGRSA